MYLNNKNIKLIRYLSKNLSLVDFYEESQKIILKHNPLNKNILKDFNVFQSGFFCVRVYTCTCRK